ncbi:SAM-dependent methyltransferase [Streptomyces umbrinus]|uniref:SAM-dependent methyltransferase n=1 Tax=Streptomyces umbrinus TaxID=67370 RepID=A0ABU0SML0_9ACTN|nr:N-6 DNA methylase [Streptomyces umbrinus]MDQ1024798.1 SAM-dependent methyltransferase [Streptomyces umbrinus]
MTTGRVEVTAADIARFAEVKPTAVSNWRKRHNDFPQPVGGTDRSPRFDLAEVEEWLGRQGKARRIAVAERLWQSFESARVGSAAEDALALTGLLLFHLHRHPGTQSPHDKAGMVQLMERAEHTFAEAPGGTVGSLGELLSPLQYELGARLLSLLVTATEAAAADGARATFDDLCARFLHQGSRSSLAATPRELADLMVTLAGAPTDGAVLDASCGSGTFLLAAADAGATRVQGQELSHSLALFAALRLAFRNTDPAATAVSFDVHTGDFLRRPAFRSGRAAAVVGHPPFADRNWGHEELVDHVSWEYGFPPRGESELAWIQQTLAHAAPGAPVVLLLPPAVAFRPSGRRIRQELLRRGALRAVLSLPAGYAAHYALALQIWVLRRPELGELPPAHVLMTDTGNEQDPRSMIQDLWVRYVAAADDASSFLERPGVARSVPVMDLLDDDVDLTPRRHLPQPAALGVSAETLDAARTTVDETLRALRSSLPTVGALPDLPDLTESARAGIRVATVAELAKSGVVVLRRPTHVMRQRPIGDVRRGQTVSASPPIPGPGQALFLTARDVVTGRSPSEVGPAPDDPVQHQPVRAGDILLPVTARSVVARVATTEDAGAYPEATLHHILVANTDILDPWYLAGFLSSAEGAHQAASTTSSLGSHTRLDPRRVRVPLFPIERQRAYGEAFRAVADFSRLLRTAHEMGQDLAKDATEAVAWALHSRGGTEHGLPLDAQTDVAR